jgi:hypothetical protein
MFKWICIESNYWARRVKVQKRVYRTHLPPYEDRIAHTARFEICLPFLSSLSFSSFQPLFCLLSTTLAPIPMPPKRAGPWQLEQVKLRLRAEQVARERTAEIRYRQVEEDERYPPRIIHITERNRGNTSWTECILCVLVTCCLLLVVSVVFVSCQNSSSVLYSHNFTTYSSNDRTYCNNKIQYTVYSGGKEKGKTIVWVKLITFIPIAYCLLVINKTISNISQCMHRE